MEFTAHTLETAPEASRDILGGAYKAYGFVPNLLAVIAETPSLLKAYCGLEQWFGETSLSRTERHVVLLTVSYENGCEYCVAAHSIMAVSQKVPDDVVQAIREGRPIADRKLESIRRFTATVVSSRGRPSQAEIAAFQDAGYSRAQILEVILGVGMKTLSNYVNHIADTPVDQVFAKAAWTKPTTE